MEKDLPPHDAVDATARYNAWKYDNPSLLVSATAAKASGPAETSVPVSTEPSDITQQPSIAVAAVAGDATETHISTNEQNPGSLGVAQKITMLPCLMFLEFLVVLLLIFRQI